MSSSKRNIGRAVCALVLAAMASALVTGCQAMANPDDSDLPWAQTQSWELTPNLPRSMLNNE